MIITSSSYSPLEISLSQKLHNLCCPDAVCSVFPRPCRSYFRKSAHGYSCFPDSFSLLKASFLRTYHFKAARMFSWWCIQIAIHSVVLDRIPGVQPSQHCVIMNAQLWSSTVQWAMMHRLDDLPTVLNAKMNSSKS